jgi:hypothetical protein
MAKKSSLTRKKYLLQPMIDEKEEIKTTVYHLVYVEGQGWVTVINMSDGDIVKTIDGIVCITKIVKKRHEETVSVYNFHIKEWALYFLWEIRMYIHNGKTEKRGGFSCYFLKNKNITGMQKWN